MTNEQKVREKFPAAFITKHKTRGPLPAIHFIVWSNPLTKEKKRLGDGETKAKAWKDAAEFIKA
jgi:hypothetical protein